jgi:predicted O-linked N-acetylglucosamine transferase (SPINDLY family)
LTVGSVQTQQAFQAAIRQHQAGQLREAEGLYRQIIAAHPNDADAMHMLGIALQQLGRGSEAIQTLRHAIGINPRAADYHANLGSILAAQRQPEAAIAEFRASLAIKPDLAEVHNGLGKLLQSQGQLDEAICEYRLALAQKVALAEAHSNLGDALKETGQLDEAIASYRRAMTLSPDVRWASNLIYALYLHPDTTPRQLFEAHQRWSQSHAEPLAAQVPVHRNDPNSGRRLRVGYVGANFPEYPRSSFILPMLAAHDRANFEIFCYVNVGEPDAITERARTLVDGWRDIAMLPDQQAAELVTRDRIDILVDLDMHSPGNRLLLLARKPAPVQVSGLAYPGTTGILAVDHRLVDSQLASDGSEEQLYSEQAIYLPETAFCYAVPSQLPPATGPPAARNGFVTFGYLGDFSRVTSRTIELWAGALGKMDGSRLLFAAPRGSCRQRLLDAFQRRGVSGARLEFIDAKPRLANLDLHRRIDIGLDTYPWNGRTTTLDAIWMGVPAITLSGQRGVSRIGSAILSRLGLEDLVAHCSDEFAAVAARLAGDLSNLTKLRSSLRQRLESSPLMEADRFTRNLESAYRRIWVRWCSSQGRQGLVTASSL